MSLLVDPDYFLHTLKLNYLRRLPDPTGPSAISFPLLSPQPGPSSSHSATQLSNPYIQLSGLSDAHRWPELLVRGSPPEPIPNPISNDNTPIRTRRRRAPNDPAAIRPPNPSGSGLRYSETLVGPKGGGMGAGMRVSGRKSIRASRRASRAPPDSKIAIPSPPSEHAKPPSQPPSQQVNVGANALALTEGRASIVPGGGLNPEDSDEEPQTNIPLRAAQPTEEVPERKPLVRQMTIETIKSHRRRVSAVTFANNPPSFTSSPATGIGQGRSRAGSQRVQLASSVTTTNTVMSSDLSEQGNQTLNSPTPSCLSRANQPSTGPEPKDGPPDLGDAVEPPTSGRRRRLDSQSHTGVYYSAAHDPDKRLSDMLFTYRPYAANRRTQIVGSVELEPAPLLGPQNEEEEAEEEGESEQTDTSTEHGDESSSNLGEIGEEEEELEDSLSMKSDRTRSKRDAGSSGGLSSVEYPPGEEGSLCKSLLSVIASSTFEPSALNRMNGRPADLVLSAYAGDPGGAAAPSPPMVRRRERRRVNIKMGKLVGPPIIEEDAAGPSGEPGPPRTKPPSHPIPAVARLTRAALSSARPSLPDLRQAVNTHEGAQEQADEQTIVRPSVLLNGLSPGRARSLTTPTPTPILAVSAAEPKTAKPDSRGGMEEQQARRVPEPWAPLRMRAEAGPTAGPGQAGARDAERQAAGPPDEQAGTKTDAGDEARKTTVTTPRAPSKPRRAPLVFKKLDLSSSSTPPTQQKSILTGLLRAKSSSSSADNPFRCFYALLASKERSALKVEIYYPFSKEPRKPIKTSMRSDVCVEEVVGFGLWKFIEEQREPKISELCKTQGFEYGQTDGWCLRLVEDDGEVDEDFPALERTRAAGKVGSNEFAIVVATEAQMKQNAVAQAQIQRRPSRVLGEPTRVSAAGGPSEVGAGTAAATATATLAPAGLTGLRGLSGITLESARTVGGGVSGSLVSGLSGSMGPGSVMGLAVYLKIRIPSPGRGVDSIMTTLNVTVDMYLADVLETLCKKKGLGPAKDWALLVPSSPSIPVHQRDIIVPLDRTVESLQGVSSLALVKRSQVSSKLLRNSQITGNFTSQNTNPSASIFKRLSETPQPKYVSISDLTSTSLTFVVQTKRRGILGKQERLLTIEDDYVHISPHHHHHPTGVGGSGGAGGPTTGPSGSGPPGAGKTSSYHVGQIVECSLRTGQNGAGVRLVVLRESGEKRYEVEAENSQSAVEIVRHIKGLKEMYHTRN